MPRPKQLTKKETSVTFRTSYALKRLIETICYEGRITATALIEGLIVDYQNKRTQKKSPR